MATKKIKNLNLGGFESKEQAAKFGYTAVSIERIHDGRILSLNSDFETYSFADKPEDEKEIYKYSYERLMDDHRAKGKFRVLGWAKNLTRETYMKIYNK